MDDRQHSSGKLCWSYLHVKIFKVSSYGRITFFVPDGARAPRWELITRRVTKDLFTGEVLQDLRHFQKADNEELFGYFDGPHRDVLVQVYYREGGTP